MEEQKFTINGGFFDSINGDRLYSADEMNRPYKRLISEGIFATPQGTPSTDLQVLSADDGMNIVVKSGEGLLGGKWFENSNDITITVPDNTGIVPRKDSVIIQIDKSESGRVPNIVYRTGTASSNPQPPEILNSDDIIEKRVANIYVAAGAVKIGQDVISDLRGSEECLWVASLIKQVDTSELFKQWQTAYEEYYKKIIKELQDIEDGSAYVLKENFNTLKSIVVAPNAGAHNAIYRGADITDLFRDGTLSKQIAAGTFDDIFIGDYIRGAQTDTKFLVADINYRLHKGDVECTTNHILVIPEPVLRDYQMNSTNDTTGGYIASDMHTKNLPEFDLFWELQFGAAHILKHRNYLSNSIQDNYANGGEWIDSTAELMTETMVYGGNIYKNCMTDSTYLPDNNEIDTSQLALFRLRPDLIAGKDINGNRQAYWLRDIVSKGQYAAVGNFGNSTYNIASASLNMRPALLLY